MKVDQTWTDLYPSVNSNNLLNNNIFGYLSFKQSRILIHFVKFKEISNLNSRLSNIPDSAAIAGISVYV